MIILIKAAQLLLSLSILVIIHELGHFIFAKLFKTRVEKFYLFFNPWFSLFKVKKGDTEYGLGWLPLGGYVKIAGMIDESMDKDQMKQPPQPHEFRSKPSGQRLLIMLGGVLFNVIFAFFIYSMILFTWGEKYLPMENAKYGIICDTLALEIGLEHGDQILSLDHKQVDDFLDVIPMIVYDGAKTIQIERHGADLDIPIPNNFIARFIEKRDFIYYAYPYVVRDLEDGYPAKAAGLRTDDRILGINGADYSLFDVFMMELPKFIGDTITLNVDRNGRQLDFSIKVPDTGKLGIWPVPPADLFELKEVDYSFLQSFPAGLKKGVNTIESYLKDLKLLFTPDTKAYKSMGGFIAIGNIFPGQWDWKRFWNLTAFLSIMLAVLNILPIPALDGGHVMFLTLEIITGRKPSDKFMEYAQIVGMILLLALVLFANGNDIIKLFTK